VAVTDYMVIHSERHEDLTVHVLNAIAAGWQPLGGAVVVESDTPLSRPALLQTMIKGPSALASITDYKLVHSLLHEDLVTHVTNAIAEGYQPLGGAVMQEPDEAVTVPTLMQTMVIGSEYLDTAVLPSYGGSPIRNAMPARGRLDFTTLTNVSDGDTVLIDAVTYTFKSPLTPAEGEVKIGASATLSATNLVSAINYEGTPGTDYSCAAAHPTVYAMPPNISDRVRLYARLYGASGNSIPVAVVAATITPYAATLYQGRDGAVGVRGQMVEQSGALFFCTADKDVNNCTYWKFASLEWPSWVYPAE